MFNGHKLYKIGKEWVFDLTEFIGYKVVHENGIVKSYEKAFTVIKSNDDTFKFNKKKPTPVGVMRKSDIIIRDYMREALVL